MKPDISRELQDKLILLYKTAVILSDAMKDVTKDESAVVTEFYLNGPIETDGAILDYISENSGQLETPQVLANTCAALQSSESIVDSFKLNVLHCMNQLREATTKDSVSTVEDIYTTIMNKYKTLLPETKIEGKILDDILEFGTELDRKLIELGLGKIFTSHQSCIYSAADQTETELEAFLAKLQTILIAKNVIHPADSSNTTVT